MHDKRNKFLSFVSGLSIILNSFVAPISAIAQEVNPSETPSPTPEIVEIVSSEIIPTVAIEPTLQPTETPLVTPEPTTQISPPAEELTPTSSLEPTPSIATEETVLPASDTIEPTAVPTQEIEPTSIPEEDPNLLPTPPPAEEALPAETLSAVIVNDAVVAEDPEFDFSVLESSSATLITDKPDYSPTDIVLIYGENYLPNTIYILELISDAGDYTFSTEITSTEEGTIEFSHQLDGTYRPNYTVTVKDTAGEIVARTTFTDSPTTLNNCPLGVIDTAGPNDEPGQKDLTRMCADYTSSPMILINWNWDDIAWSGNNSGDACSLYDNNNNGLIDYAFCVTIGGDPANIDSYQLYSCGDDKNDRCTNKHQETFSQSQCTIVPLSNTDPFIEGSNYPNDTQAQCSIFLTEVGGINSVLVDVCSYPSQQPNSDPSDCVVYRPSTGRLEIQKSLIPTTDTGRFNLEIGGIFAGTGENVGNGGTTGELILDTGTYQIGESAYTGTSLSSYSTSIECRDLNGTGSIVASSTNSGPLSVTLDDGEDVVCVITNTLRSATLTLVKTVVNNNGGTATTADFQAYIDTNPVSWSTPITLNTGSYTASESTLLSGYTAGSWGGDCAPDGSVTLNPGEDKTCTITNDDDASTLIVKKIVTNDNGGNLEADDFTFVVNTGNAVAFEADGQNDLTVNAGTYNITEPAVSGYSTTYDNCTNVVIPNGGSATCTITNNDIPPKLTLVKTVTNDDGGDNGASEWILTATGDGGISGNGVQDAVLNKSVFGPNDVKANVAYFLSESGPSGYTASAWTCDGGTVGASAPTVILSPGDDVTCTINNDDVAPTITLIKSVINNNGGSAGVNSFGLTIGVTPVTSGQVLPVNANTPYALDEVVLSGYSFDSLTGDTKCPDTLGGTVTLDEGENVTCTITNDDQQAYITVVKVVTNDNGGNAQPNDFLLTLEGAPVSSGVAVPVDPGTYTAAETLLPGYEFTRFSGDCDVNGDVTVALGQSKTCTLTNDDIAPKLTLIKDPTNDNGGNAAPDDFLLTIGGNAATSGVAYALRANTAYTINETQLTGYTFVSITGDTKCPQVLGGTVTLDEGDDITCTIKNDDTAPKLTLIKDPTNDNGGNAAPDDFALTIGGSAALSGTEYTLDANTPYAINETQLTGYTFVSITGDTKCPQVLGGTVTLDEGDDITCTIKNDDIPSTITVCKYEDINGNGYPNDIDTPLQDVTINLEIFENNAYASYLSGTTGRDGCYIFSNIPQGAFKISEIVPTGYYQTYPSNPNTFIVNVGLDQQLSYKFLNSPYRTISGYKFEDVNSDGIWDNGELPLSGWTINLNTGASTTTDSDGYYEFTGLVSDLYIINETQQTGWEITTPLSNLIEAEVHVAVTSTDNNFGNFELGKIMVCKYDDGNANGDLQDTDNTPMGGITINLYKLQSIGAASIALLSTPSYVLVRSLVTPETGCVTFDGLSYGTYKVDEEGNPGYYLTYPSDPYYEGIQVTSGFDNTNEPYIFLNAGFSSIGDTIWLDLNGNGIQDGEGGIEGVTVYLYKDDGDGIFEPTAPISGMTADEYIGTRSTDVNGEYIFQLLRTGDYWVDPEPASPAILGLKLTTSAPYFINDLLPGVVQLDADFGYQPLSKGISLTKSNNRPVTGAGDTVTYTLTITNTGEVPLSDVTIYDVPPGGFTYIAGTTLLDDVVFGNPTISGGKLLWNIGILDALESKTIKYQVKLDSDLRDGRYTNIAVCKAYAFRELVREVLFDSQFGEQLVECNVVNSTVEIGQNVDVSASVKGQVLGMTLPATGSDTTILYTLLGILFMGISFKVVSYRLKRSN